MKDCIEFSAVGRAGWRVVYSGPLLLRVLFSTAWATSRMRIYITNVTQTFNDFRRRFEKNTTLKQYLILHETFLCLLDNEPIHVRLWAFF